MGRAINMENQIDTLTAKLEIMEKRVKLLELQVKTLENNEKATKVIPIAESPLGKGFEQKDKKLELNEEDAKETIENSKDIKKKKVGKKSATSK